MILLDANIFMYAMGSSHPHKGPSLALLARIVEGEVEAVVDAEVLQEILHRYRAIGRWDDGKEVYDLARVAVPRVLSVTAETADAARRLMDRHRGLTARDALHAASCSVADLAAICSYDRGFDVIDDLVRLEPDQVVG